MLGLTENHKHVRRRLEPLRLPAAKPPLPPANSHVDEKPTIFVSVVEAFGVRYRGGTLFDAGMDWSCGGKKSYLANRFVEECVRLSQLRHPNVVMLYGIVMDGPSLTLAMELPAASLDDLLRHYEAIPEFMKTAILLDAARGLLYLHKQKPAIAHTRVSTRSVYVSPSMCAKLGDVGVAGALCESTAESVPSDDATAGKMPPQAFIKILETGTKRLDVQVDVPAFGNVIVHTLCQRRWLDPPGHTSLSPYLHTVKTHHPLYSLAYHCLLGGVQLSDQKLVPLVDMDYAVQCLQHAASNNPSPFTNTLELLQVLRAVERNAKQRSSNSTLTHHYSAINVLNEPSKRPNQPKVTSAISESYPHSTTTAAVSSHIPTNGSTGKQHSPPPGDPHSSSSRPATTQPSLSQPQYKSIINSRHNSTGQVRSPPPKPPQRSSSFRRKSCDQPAANCHQVGGESFQRAGSFRVRRSPPPPPPPAPAVESTVTQHAVQQQSSTCTPPVIKTASSGGGGKRKSSLLLPSKFNHKEDTKQAPQSPPQHSEQQTSAAVSLQPSSNPKCDVPSSNSEFEKLLARQRDKIEADLETALPKPPPPSSSNGAVINYLSPSLEGGLRVAATDMDLPGKKSAPAPPRRTSSFRSRQKYRYQSYSSSSHAADEVALRRHSDSPNAVCEEAGTLLPGDQSPSSTSPSTGQSRPNSSADYQLQRLSGAVLSETIFS